MTDSGAHAAMSRWRAHGGDLQVAYHVGPMATNRTSRTARRRLSR